jgi:hypothetical protein
MFPFYKNEDSCKETCSQPRLIDMLNQIKTFSNDEELMEGTLDGIQQEVSFRSWSILDLLLLKKRKYSYYLSIRLTNLTNLWDVGCPLSAILTC